MQPSSPGGPATDKLPILGVTGISGSGTSTVAKILRKRGGFIIQADKLVHQFMRQGNSVYDEIVNAFGAEILDQEGEINRSALGALVFGSENKEKLSILENIIHPSVVKKIFELVNNAALSGRYKFAVIDAPLLIESGLNKSCDMCWLVTASNETRLKRIIARDKIDIETAKKRLNSRNGDEALHPFVDVIIKNNGEYDILRRQVISHLKKFFKGVFQ